MIRAVAIPPLAVNRIGQLVMSQGCVQYQDPTTGLWVSDPNTPACGSGSGGDQLPGDPGAGGALSDWASAQSQASSQQSLQQSGVTSPSFALAESLFGGNVPSPLPGLGLITVPDPLKKFLIWGAVAIGILYLNGEHRSAR